ncbi:LexA family protein [Phytohalomonas tamaricis]|uniref:LexA family protein n=1 Tax=Phytohalomonas tamaricis TaxID=2081032 RepID=UPI002948C31B|nr:LexA family transcriptional regulator [Phytohalomonas tamaricis]
MKDISEVRLENARALAEQIGGTGAFAAKIDREPTQASRFMGRNPSKRIGDRLARHIEQCFNKPRGWLDFDHGSKKLEVDANVLPTSQPQTLHTYPVINWVRAGGWTEAVNPYDQGCEQHFESTDYKAKGAAFWLEVEGDSMTAPTGISIPRGMMILIDPEIKAENGSLVVAQLDENNEATFKKLVIDGGQKYLKPLNPAYPVIPINGNCRIVGVAVEMKMNLRQRLH